MRRILSFCLLSVVLLLGNFDNSIAQHILQSKHNTPRPGDELIKYQVSYKDPGRSGENVLWDFSRLKEEDDSYTLKYVEGRDSLIAGIEHRTMYYYDLTGDSLLCRGYENQTTLMENRQPELLLRFPVKYQDKTSSYYYGEGKYCDRLSITAMGTIETHADAYGVIILPGEDTLRNVIRVKTVKRIAERTLPYDYKVCEGKALKPVSSDSIDYRLANDSVILSVETFRWYMKGYRYPVFETVKSVTNKKGSESKYFDVAFFYPPEDHFYLEEDEANQSVLEELKNEGDNRTDNLWYGLTYNYLPNPVVNDLEVEIYLPRPSSVKIQVTERSGKVVINEDWGNKPEGVFSQQVFMSHIPRGEYVVNIRLDDGYMISGVVFKR